jgi:hypothetical protein
MTTNDLLEYLAYRYGLPGVRPQVFPAGDSISDMFNHPTFDQIIMEVRRRPLTAQQKQRYSEILSYQT